MFKHCRTKKNETIPQASYYATELYRKERKKKTTTKLSSTVSNNDEKIHQNRV